VLYEVDFAEKINECFYTIHNELIYAGSVSECKHQAKEIRDTLNQYQKREIHIFIEA
jgi:hypothetical protein